MLPWQTVRKIPEPDASSLLRPPVCFKFSLNVSSQRPCVTSPQMPWRESHQWFSFTGYLGVTDAQSGRRSQGGVCRDDGRNSESWSLKMTYVLQITSVNWTQAVVFRCSLAECFCFLVLTCSQVLHVSKIHKSAVGIRSQWVSQVLLIFHEGYSWINAFKRPISWFIQSQTGRHAGSDVRMMWNSSLQLKDAVIQAALLLNPSELPSIIFTCPAQHLVTFASAAWWKTWQIKLKCNSAIILWTIQPQC